jgi:hypothetical protein
MSSVQLYETTKQRADRMHGDYGFILALVCGAGSCGCKCDFCAIACW